MFFQMNSEYIQYLNDPYKNGMNYDQWKEQKKRQQSDKTKILKPQNTRNLFRKVNYNHHKSMSNNIFIHGIL